MVTPAVLAERLVLPPDVVISAIESLAEPMRRALRHERGFTITRLRRRRNSKLIDAASAELLEEFRRPQRVVDAVAGHARRRGLAPERLMRDAFPVLRDCINARLLVPEHSADAREILPAFDRGARIAGFRVLRCVRALEDSELYQVRGPGGAQAALKLLAPEKAAAAGDCIAREAAVLRLLDGVAAPRLLATGRFGDQPYLVLEWCAGVSPLVAAAELRSSPARRGALLTLCRDLAAVYVQLHARGVIHADVHPGNLLVTREGRPVVLDFGLAELAGAPKGWPAAERGGVAWYLTPEAARAALAERPLPRATRAGDQYALAAMLYLLITGDHYLDFASDKEALLRQIVGAPPLPFARRGVPPMPAIEQVLGRALHKQAGRRWPSLAAFATAFEGAAVGAVKAGGGHRASHPPGAAATALHAGALRLVQASGRAFAAPLTDRASASVSLGAAGIAHALYRLASVRGDARALFLADSWLTKVEREAVQGPAFATAAAPESFGRTSPWHTESGAHAVRALLAQAMGATEDQGPAVERFVAASRRAGRGNDLYLGRAGTLVASALLLEALPAIGAASRSRLLGLGAERRAAVGRALERTRRARTPDWCTAHGRGGMVFGLLRWAQATGESPAPVVERTLRQIAAHAEEVGRGVYWPSRSTSADGRPVPGYLTSWCNGSAGMVFLWLAAHRVYGRPALLDWAMRTAWGVWEDPSEDADLCCGLTGRAWALLACYRHTGERLWLDRARALGRRVAQTWSRLPASAYPLSLYRGIMGPALLMAELECPERSCMPFFEAEGWPVESR